MVGRAGNEVADRGAPQEVVGTRKNMVERLKFGSNLFGDKVFFGRSPCSFGIEGCGMGGSKCRESAKGGGISAKGGDDRGMEALQEEDTPAAAAGRMLK